MSSQQAAEQEELLAEKDREIEGPKKELASSSRAHLPATATQMTTHSWSQRELLPCTAVPYEPYLAVRLHFLISTQRKTLKFTLMIGCQPYNEQHIETVGRWRRH